MPKLPGVRGGATPPGPDLPAEGMPDAVRAGGVPGAAVLRGASLLCVPPQGTRKVLVGRHPLAWWEQDTAWCMPWSSIRLQTEIYGSTIRYRCTGSAP